MSHLFLGFYDGKNICGDAMTRGIGGPECRNKPHRVRWCPQCKALFQWDLAASEGGWDRGDCAICRHRQGVPVAFAKIAQLMAALSSYKELPGGIRLIPWSEYLAELQFVDLTGEQFLAANLADLRKFWEHLATEYKRKRAQSQGAA